LDQKLLMGQNKLKGKSLPTKPFRAYPAPIITECLTLVVGGLRKDLALVWLDQKLLMGQNKLKGKSLPTKPFRAYPAPIIS